MTTFAQICSIVMRHPLYTYISCWVMLFLLSPAIMHGQKTDDVINPIKLDAAVHSEKMTRSTQKGDTLVMNAAAYQVVQGADSESLIAKMPGISVTYSGIEAAGKDVKRILLDGQEFFGEDAMAALRAVPADMVKQIEIINRLSDNAQLTGIDDGEGYTAINIVSKKKKGDIMTTGKVYGSFGLPDSRYIAGGNISRFSDKNSLNVIGMSNNINKTNFPSSDIISGVSGTNSGGSETFNVKSLPGISSVHALGVNYSDDKKNFIYFVNYLDNMNEQESGRLTMTSQADRKQHIKSRSDYEARQMSHNFSGKMKLSPAKNHTIIIRPQISFDNTDDHKDAYSLYRYIYDEGDPKFIRNQLITTTNDKWILRAGANMTYRYAFKNKKKRSLSTFASYNLYKNRNKYDSYQYRFNKEDTDYDIEGNDLYNTYIQDKSTDMTRHVSTVRLTFTEPVTRRSLLSAAYGSTIYYTDNDNPTYVLNNKTLEYSKSDKLSSINNTAFLHNRLTGRYSYTLKQTTLTIGATWQHTLFDGRMTLPSVNTTTKNFHHLLYQLTANLPINSKNQIRIDSKGTTSNPSNTMIQDVVNMSNSSNIRAGNPDIVPAYLHETGISYIRTDRKSGTTLSLSASFTGSSNYFCDSLVINNPDFEVMEGVKLGENNQYVKPVNLKGYYTINLKGSFGIPLGFIRCNFNINGLVSLRQLPSMINEDFIPIRTNRYQLGGRLDSNISKYFDFTIGYSARYNCNEYSGKFGLVQNNYFTHRITGRLKWILLKRFTFTGGAQYIQSKSMEERYNDKMMLCDLFLGHRFLKDKTLEISVGVNDLFNDNTRHYWHSVTSSGVSDGVRSGIGRYFSLQCIWHLRSIR